MSITRLACFRLSKVFLRQGFEIQGSAGAPLPEKKNHGRQKNIE